MTVLQDKGKTCSSGPSFVTSSNNAHTCSSVPSRGFSKFDTVGPDADKIQPTVPLKNTTRGPQGAIKNYSLQNLGDVNRKHNVAMVSVS